MDTVTILSAALEGRYVIEREVGAGGMATVYLARDVKHNRHVALKVLNANLGAVLGTDRFLAEIQVTANLQHPNLLPLFDSGEAEGLLFYVMPYVDGETLRQRLEREKQLPVDDAIRIATAVASALDYAHRHGVIHRDLKPENILLHDGQPVVADFGIALAISNAGGARVTQTGISLGTPQYMSPEQATGDRVIDARTDIYSLGAVTYEMLAGEPPHAAATAQGVVAKLMTEHPRPLSVLRRRVPPGVDAAVQRALEKLPADRFATAREFAAALEAKDTTTRPATSVSVARKRWPMVVACGVAAALAMSTAWGWMIVARRSDPPTIRLKLDLPATQRIDDAPGMSVEIAPDGQTVAYLARDAQQPRAIFVRRLDELQARVLPGTNNAEHLTFSPDGRWISFMGDGERIMKVPVDRGAPVLLATSTAFEGNAWISNSGIVYSSEGSIWTLTAPGQIPTKIAAPDLKAGEVDLSGPFVLPNDGGILYALARTYSPNGSVKLGIVSRANPKPRTVDLLGASPLGYVDGWLIYGRPDQTIAAIKFDPRAARTSGESITLLEGVFWKNEGGLSARLSASGSLIYLRGGTNSFLATLSANGSALSTTSEARAYWSPVWSPDGKRVAVEVRSGSTGVANSIWVGEVASGVFSRITTRVSAERPSWTSDGNRIAFINSEDAGASNVWWVPSDGSGPEERFYSLSGHPLREVTFSPDGRYAVFRTNPVAKDGVAALWVRPLQGNQPAAPLAQSAFNEIMPAVSPNGSWLAYESDATGVIEVYVRAFPGPSGFVQVSSGGGGEPRWLADGRLVYRGGGAFRSATISALVGRPTVVRRDSLFADTFRPNETNRQNYDIAKDGRFVVPRDASLGRDIVVVVNWLTEVRARLRSTNR